METASPELLAKVKKLLALGASPSEAEAASAMEKARLLLARYGLTISDVDTAAPEVVESVILEKRRLRSWESVLIHVIAQCTFTQALHVSRGQTAQVLLIGREINTLAARELFAYLHLVVLKLGREYGTRVDHLESFKCGVVERIGERLAESSAGTEEAGGIWVAPNADGAKSAEMEPGEGTRTRAGANTAAADRQLVVLMNRTAERENRAFIEEKYGKTGTKRVGRRVEPSSYYTGRRAAETVSLSRQLR